jgi:hypothetical protein
MNTESYAVALLPVSAIVTTLLPATVVTETATLSVAVCGVMFTSDPEVIAPSDVCAPTAKWRCASASAHGHKFHTVDEICAR